MKLYSELSREEQLKLWEGIPKDYEYIAVDRNLQLAAYETKPTATDYVWCTGNGCYNLNKEYALINFMAAVALEKGWKNSLIERPKPAFKFDCAGGHFLETYLDQKCYSSRKTTELAKRAAQERLKFYKLQALRDTLDDGGELTHLIYFNYSNKEYQTGFNRNVDTVGSILFSEKSAYRACELLDRGEVVL